MGGLSLAWHLSCVYAWPTSLPHSLPPCKVLEFTHFACTSEDINNLSHALMLKEAVAGQVRL